LNTSSPTNWMILLTYRIRDGADADGYDDWLRTIDNPFFNAIPGIKCYTNWKVHETAQALPFTHFDFLEIDNVEELESLWFCPELNTFRTEWVRLWGRGVPDPDNARCYLSESVAGGLPPQSSLVLQAGAARATGSEATEWTTRELLHKHYAAGATDDWRTSVVDTAPFAKFSVTYTAAPLAAAAMDHDAALSATLIAAPDGFVGSST